MGQRYLDFDLGIWKAPNGYEANAYSPAGGAGPLYFSPPFLSGAARAAWVAGEPLMALGRHLFNAVFQGEIRRAWCRCRAEAKRTGKILRLRVSPQGPESSEWPWEALYDNGFLALSPECSLTRWTLLQKPVSRAKLFFKTRVLVVVAPPERRTEPWIEREVDAIQESLKGRRDVTVLRDRTLRDFQASLPRPVHILHFIKKEKRDADSPPDHEWRHEGADLVALLKRQKSPDLVVLHDCRPRVSTLRASAGVVQCLAKQGIPAVLEMQSRALDEPCLGFIQAFYGALAAGEPVDQAVWKARHCTAAQLESASAWAHPILHLSGHR